MIAGLKIPEFATYEEEADFWDQLDTAPYMEDDGEWSQFETPGRRTLSPVVSPLGGVRGIRTATRADATGRLDDETSLSYDHP
jgi:hypothetical protein